MRIGDLDALKEAIANVYPSFRQRMGIKDVFEAIKNAPTIDAVEVVRCKDCAFNDEFAWHACPMLETAKQKDNDFCSKEERRTDEQAVSE